MIRVSDAEPLPVAPPSVICETRDFAPSLAQLLPAGHDLRTEKTLAERSAHADDPAAHRPPTWAVAAALAVIFLVLAIPGRPVDLGAGALAALPLELPILTALLLASARFGSLKAVLRGLVLAFLGLTVVLKLADYSFFTALNRPFNIAFDMPLVRAGWMLLSGTAGLPAALTYAAMAMAGFLILIGLFWWATGVLASLGMRHGGTFAAALALVCFAGLASAMNLGSAKDARLLYDHATAAIEARRDIAALANEAADDPAADLSAGGFLPSLGHRDVILAFVESYGRSAHDNPLYAATTHAALGHVERDLRQRGLAMRSGWLASPVVGGQSWLAHATLLSGLWIDSQGRYRALLQSERRTLISLAAAAGRRAVAVMPAITMPWPESSWFGYSHVYAANDLGYRGLPFNWVTMPDQYTWSALERLELARADQAPLFAEVALISSHAPWTPIPTLVPWDEIGDGTIFNVQATSGDSPETVWRDKARIRDQYRKAIKYALQAIGSFAARHATNPPLLIVLGDHQPAVLVSGSETVRDVPVHIIGDPETISHLDGWGWTDGLQPSADAPVWRMDRFRDRILDAFAAHKPAPDAAHGPV
jgi:hypothetical protein